MIKNGFVRIDEVLHEIAADLHHQEQICNKKSTPVIGKLGRPSNSRDRAISGARTPSMISNREREIGLETLLANSGAISATIGQI
ncbi:hypothetical protein TIFTF001_016905 [Ficus carica]|uniref:Uncharacterized protein n=1 Tax=Ficus carica TaxID=3494 RepID=A0AA88A171_FICCA|nr:hypothetical protein TIFTF001_016905 [Ficus carica]